ncbi:MAG: PAS domain S-box protein [Chroococcidiopsidaceae cyanobacterium CP_BM_RX_35]|nr:PAS domain S-box protein [Chroococcidiopsidaceae cyanobacterium CP_BM_RX_35]
MSFGNDVQNQSTPPFTVHLEEELQFAKFLVNHVVDAVFWLDPDAKFLYVNDVACCLLGYSREELLSLSMHEVDIDFTTEVWLERWRSLKQQGSLTFETRHRTKKGRVIPMEVTLAYVRYHSRGFSCAFAREKAKHTEKVLQQSEAQFRILLEKPEALEQEKERTEQRARFVSMLCHEVRTSLNIISFSTSLMRLDSYQWVEEEKQLYLDYIQTTVEQISQLLDEVLLLDKVEARKLKFEPNQIDLTTSCDNLVTQMQLTDNGNQHVIAFASQGNCSTAYLDKKLLQSILTNLLSNAIKYSPIGSTVNFNLYCQDGNAIFQIKDAGIGIPAAEQQWIFEPFHRGSNVGDVPGTGLGLAVVKKLVDFLYGQIALNSEVGVGTTFTLTLPLVSKGSEK